MKKLILDVFYNEKTGIAHTTGVVFHEWTDNCASEVYFANSPIQAEYVPGQFYKRELPAIAELLKKIDLNEYDTIIVDGLYMLWDGKPGLGKHLEDYLDKIGHHHIDVIGIAKSQPRDAEKFATLVVRGEDSTNPLVVNGSLNYDYDNLIKSMHGKHRLPTLIKLVDKFSRDIIEISFKK